MKTRNILLISTLLVLLLTACKKEGGFDHRSRHITKSLNGKKFTVLRMIGVNHAIDLNQNSKYKGSRMLMSFDNNNNNTSLDFVPGDTNYRFTYLDDPWRNVCKIAGYQHFYMSYSIGSNVILTTSTDNPPDMLITQVAQSGQGIEVFPMIALDGKYEVVKGYVNGNPGFILNKYENYSKQGNGRGQRLMSIELITR
jgi:hypothetical protein